MKHSPLPYCDEPFELSNPPPKRKRLDVPNTTGVQKVLLAGLGCLPGQKNLFSTDGDKAHDDTR